MESFNNFLTDVVGFSTVPLKLRPYGAWIIYYIIIIIDFPERMMKFKYLNGDLGWSTCW